MKCNGLVQSAWKAKLLLHISYTLIVAFFFGRRWLPLNVCLLLDLCSVSLTFTPLQTEDLGNISDDGTDREHSTAIVSATSNEEH